MDPNLLEENEIRCELALRGKPFETIRQAQRELRINLREEKLEEEKKPKCPLKNLDEETVESYESFNNINEMMTYDSAKKNRVVMATVYARLCHVEGRIQRWNMNDFKNDETLKLARKLMSSIIEFRNKYYKEKSKKGELGAGKDKDEIRKNELLKELAEIEHDQISEISLGEVVEIEGDSDEEDEFPEFHLSENHTENNQQQSLANQSTSTSKIRPFKSFNSLPVHKWDIHFDGNSENGEVLEFLRNIKEMALSERVDTEELRRRANFLFIGGQKLGKVPNMGIIGKRIKKRFFVQ